MRIACLMAALVLAGCDHVPGKTAGKDSVNSPAPAPQASIVGRFNIIHSPQTERDTMLLDTATGQTWQLVQLNQYFGEPAGWQPVYKTDEDEAALLVLYGLKANGPPPKP